MKELRINLEKRSYSIFIGGGILQEIEFLRYCPDKRAAVVSDENVWSLHGKNLGKVFENHGIAFHAVIVPAGEKSKSMETLARLYKEFAGFGLKRTEPVIAFGGGVVGDLAGFAASTYMRGVPFIQIPTTLLAQVDSGVGGKVAINLDEGKNLVGSFYQPELVVADTEILETLPEREWNAGLAEVVKYAAIGEQGIGSILREPDAPRKRIDEIVFLSCKSKAGYVERDERDTGDRMMLNFGHTFGHAIEKIHGYERYNHGEAVAIGMALATRAGILLGVSKSPDVEKELIDMMNGAGLKYLLEDDIAGIIPLMSGDKKNSGNMLTLVLLEEIGKSIIYKISPDELLRAFREDGNE